MPEQERGFTSLYGASKKDMRLIREQIDSRERAAGETFPGVSASGLYRGFSVRETGGERPGVVFTIENMDGTFDIFFTPQAQEVVAEAVRNYRSELGLDFEVSQ